MKPAALRACLSSGRRPGAWQPPDWFLAQSDGTFGNRFDDPDGYYRVIYASSQRLTCYIETLARFRPSLSLLAELDEIEGDNDLLPLGTLPREWLAGRMMGKATLDGIFADVSCGSLGWPFAQDFCRGSVAAWHTGHRSEYA